MALNLSKQIEAHMQRAARAARILVHICRGVREHKHTTLALLYNAARAYYTTHNVALTHLSHK
jgi:hypothetical protein